MNNINKTIAFVLVILLSISCFIFTACTPNDPADVHTAPSTSVFATEEATQTQPASTESKGSNLILLPSYIPTKAFDSNGEEVSLSQVYGSGLRDYGGSLSFKEDGTFTTFIGVFGNVNNESGTYKVISDTEIEMLYNNDKTEIAEILQTDSDGNVTQLRMTHRSHEVEFTAE